MSSPANIALPARAGACPRAPLRVAISDHQGKSLALSRALVAAGHEVVADPGIADVALIDHDIPFHGKLPIAEACVAAGGRVFLYPHGADPTLMCGWDGLYPVSPLLSGALVSAAGHAEIARRFGYPHPVHAIGWSLCELRERDATGNVENVLFAPMHPPWSGDWNREIFAGLLKLPVKLTVRHLGALEDNNIPRVGGVEYVQGNAVDFDEMIRQIDEADVVVAARGTFVSLAVARGAATVTWSSDWVGHNDEPRQAEHAHLYCDYLRFPFDAAYGDLWETIQAAAADDELAADWRRRFVGDAFDVDRLVAILRGDDEQEVETTVNVPALRALEKVPDELHREALARVEAGDFGSAAALLTRAVAAALDLDLVNDLAAVKAALGDSDAAEALLRACLVVEPDHEDARENLAELGRGSETTALEDAGGWRRSTTLGGANPHMPERAFPGMPGHGTMAEHAIRYGYTLQLVGGKHVLDLGCGTGYGSEMLTWTAASVRGFDLWEPEAHELPRWSGGAVLTYRHDLCRDPLPDADAAVMFEVIEHLGDAPAALREVWSRVDLVIASFPNPRDHGSHHNHFHVNDWTLEQFERHLAEAAHASGRFKSLELAHLQQAMGGLLVPGRDPEASFWVVVARGLR